MTSQAHSTNSIKVGFSISRCVSISMRYSVYMLASLDLPNISAAAYRLSSSTGDMSGSGLTKTMSVGNGNSNTTGHHHHHQPAGPVLTELTQSDQQLFQGAGQDSQWHRSIGEDQVYRQSHDQMYRQSHDQMYRQSHAYNMDLMGGGMSHSFTLPHSLSHHSSKFIP